MPRVDNDGVDTIQSTNRKQNGTGGIRQDAVLVIDEERPFNPDRDVPRKTEIIGMGFPIRDKQETGREK